MSSISSSHTVERIRRTIAEVKVVDLARQFGTPLYVYDAETIGRQIARLRSFDIIRYAQKACSSLAIVDLMRRHSVLVDCVSAGEIRRALRAGYTTGGDPPPIVYTADIFDRESLELVIEEHVHVNCGSPDMIDQFGRRAPGREITLRINPGFGHGHSRKTNTGGEQSKHGIWHKDLGDCVGRADDHGLAVTGLHIHIGSGTDLEHLGEVCQAMERTALEVGRTITSISAGGGLPVPYREGEAYVDVEAYHRLWECSRQRLAETFGHAVRLEIEPGRYLVAESGFLVCEIRAVKHMGNRLFYLVDAGFNCLARPVLYGAYHPMSIAPLESAGDGRALRDVVVGGPLCESGDIFTQEEGGFVSSQPLPAAEVGDLLVIEAAGAYGFAMASNYNSKTLAAEVLIHDGSPHLVRRRQTFDEMVQGEILPGQE